MDTSAKIHGTSEVEKDATKVRISQIENSHHDEIIRYAMGSSMGSLESPTKELSIYVVDSRSLRKIYLK